MSIFDTSIRDGHLLRIFFIIQYFLLCLFHIFFRRMNMKSTNLGALNLYEKLGFARDEKLARYYLNGGRTQIPIHYGCSPVSHFDFSILNVDFKS